MDNTETEDVEVKAIVGAILLAVGIVVGTIALLWAEAWAVATLLSIAFGVECMDLWALAGLVLLFNLSVAERKHR